MSRHSEEKTGSVALVGAGCGAGLITVRGLELLRRADVLVYDDLLDDDLLLEVSSTCEKIYEIGRASCRERV